MSIMRRLCVCSLLIQYYFVKSQRNSDGNPIPLVFDGLFQQSIPLMSTSSKTSSSKVVSKKSTSSKSVLSKAPKKSGFKRATPLGSSESKASMPLGEETSPVLNDNIFAMKHQRSQNKNPERTKKEKKKMMVMMKEKARRYTTNDYYRKKGFTTRKEQDGSDAKPKRVEPQQVEPQRIRRPKRRHRKEFIEPVQPELSAVATDPPTNQPTESYDEPQAPISWQSRAPVFWSKVIKEPAPTPVDFPSAEAEIIFSIAPTSMNLTEISPIDNMTASNISQPFPSDDDIFNATEANSTNTSSF